MLDTHAVWDTTGHVTAVTPSTIPSGDGQVSAGVPLNTALGKAVLIAWAVWAVASANGPKSAILKSNDLNDPVNGSTYTPGGTSTAPYCTPHMFERLPYKTGARSVTLAQKAAGDCAVAFIDHYNPADIGARGGCVMGDRLPANRGLYSQAFAGALTLAVWGTVGLAPTNNLPAGRYALLGFAASNLTNMALVRFSHADFGAAKPGMLATDKFTLAPTIDLLAGDPLLIGEDLTQFVRLGEITKQPQCPVFSAGPNGTGLVIEALALNADTPTIVVNLARVG